jgi:hypothetical protein
MRGIVPPPFLKDYQMSRRLKHPPGAHQFVTLFRAAISFFAAGDFPVPSRVIKAPGASPGTLGRWASPVRMASGMSRHAESPGSRRGLLLRARPVQSWQQAIAGGGPAARG